MALLIFIEMGMRGVCQRIDDDLIPFGIGDLLYEQLIRNSKLVLFVYVRKQLHLTVLVERLSIRPPLANTSAHCSLGGLHSQ